MMAKVLPTSKNDHMSPSGLSAQVLVSGRNRRSKAMKLLGYEKFQETAALLVSCV